MTSLSKPFVCIRSFRGVRLCCAASLAIIAIHSASCKRSVPTVRHTAVGQDPVAIQIGERKVRLSELQAEVDFLDQKHSPTAVNREAFLEPCIERLVVLEKARRMGLDQDIELRRQWENLLIGRLKQTEIDLKLAELSVTDEEIKAYYQSNIEKYSSPAQVHLALLFLKVPDHSEPEAREAVRLRMEEARNRAIELPKDTRGFGADAMAYSEEPTSRFKGGDIGWLQAGASSYRWPAAVIDAGFALKENGSVGDVVVTDEGFYLLKKLESREAAVRSLDGRMRATLESSFLNEKRAVIVTQLKDAWKTEADMTVHDDVISKLEFHSTPGKSGSDKTFPVVP